MKPDSSFAAKGYCVVRQWLAAALLLAVVAAGGLVATAATANAQTGTLDADNCAAGGAWVTDGGNAALAQDCRALVAAHNAWIATGTNDAGSRLATWGSGSISSWVGVGLGVPDAVSNRDSEVRVTSVQNPHFGHAGGSLVPLPGGLPTALCDLAALERLVIVRGNALAGSTWPACFGTELSNLQEIDLSDTGIGGTLSPAWCNQPDLGLLRLANNNFTGTIPSCLGQSNGNQDLTVVQLQRNSFVGSIPASLARNSQVQVADLSNNRLDGSLPGGWANIIALLVGSNDLSGGLPSDFAANGNLIIFNADSNRLTGSIPVSWTNSGSSRIDRVVEFDVSDNRLSGTINVDWLDDISFVNADYQLSVELDNNNFCFSSPRAIDTPALVAHAPNELLSVPHQPAYNSDGRRIPGLQTQSAGSSSRLSAFNLRNQNCDNPALANSNLALPQLFPASVTTNDAGLTVTWDAPVDPATGTPYDVTFYGVAVSGPGNVRGHFVPDPVSTLLLQTVDGALAGLGGIQSTLLNAAHVQITPPGSRATSINLRFAGSTRLPAEQYEISVWPFLLRGTLSLSGFNTVFIPSDSATGLWQATNVVAAGVTEGQVLRGLDARTAFAWDGTRQDWTRLNNTASTTPLARGTGLLLSQGDPTNPLNFGNAGTGRLDQGDSFTLYPGWNLISPAGALLNRPLNRDDNQALFWDERLWACSSNQAMNHGGLAAILAYNAASSRWKAHVTCAPNQDVTAQGFLPLNQLDTSDFLFVFFNSERATDAGAISWNSAAREYQAG